LDAPEFDLADLRRLFGQAGPGQVVMIDAPPGKEMTSLKAEKFALLSSGMEIMAAARRLLR
jgi:hypothetical protein